MDIAGSTHPAVCVSSSPIPPLLLERMLPSRQRSQLRPKINQSKEKARRWNVGSRCRKEERSFVELREGSCSPPLLTAPPVRVNPTVRNLLIQVLPLLLGSFAPHHSQYDRGGGGKVGGSSPSFPKGNKQHCYPTRFWQGPCSELCFCAVTSALVLQLLGCLPKWALYWHTQPLWWQTSGFVRRARSQVINVHTLQLPSR